MNDCIFCKIINGEIPTEKIYEDDDTFVFADISPVNLGHSLVLPKKHYRNIFDLPPELFAKMELIAQKIAKVLKENLAADGVNIHMNNEEAAGQVVFHAHLHVIPRYKNDGFTYWHGPKRSAEEIKEASEKIRSVILKP